MLYNVYTNNNGLKCIITETRVIIKSIRRRVILIHTFNSNDTLELNENLIKIIAVEFDYISSINTKVYLDVVIGNYTTRHFYNVCKHDFNDNLQVECTNDTHISKHLYDAFKHVLNSNLQVEYIDGTCKKTIPIEECSSVTKTSSFINSYQFESFVVNYPADRFEYLIIYAKEFLIYTVCENGVFDPDEIFFKSCTDTSNNTLTKNDIEVINYFKSIHNHAI